MYGTPALLVVDSGGYELSDDFEKPRKIDRATKNAGRSGAPISILWSIDCPKTVTFSWLRTTSRT